LIDSSAPVMQLPSEATMYTTARHRVPLEPPGPAG
jgi:hypothetical protein